MRIGLLSDTHDDLQALGEALHLFRQEGIVQLLHCGDVCGPAVVEALEGFTVHVALGNMDRAPGLALAVEARQGRGRLARCHFLLLDGLQVALLHGDDQGLLRRLISSRRFAYVFHGHTHRRADRRVGDTRVINPGALGGIRHEPRSVCLLDLALGQARFVELTGRRSQRDE